MLKPWISNEGPKVPKGWGLDAYRGRVPLTCDHCGIPLVLGDQYLYQYASQGTAIFHNKKECYEGSVV